VFDHMTPAEHLVAFLWFTRPGGSGVARALLPAETWRRFEWREADGFYHTGQVVNPEARVKRLMAERGLSAAAAANAATAVVAKDVIAGLPGYVLSMPALIYRGIWADALTPLNLVLLGLLLRRWWRQQCWVKLAVLVPAGWSLLAYPALSLNIPRYQYSSLIVFALAAALEIERFVMTRASAAPAQPRAPGRSGDRGSPIHSPVRVTVSDEHQLR